MKRYDVNNPLTTQPIPKLIRHIAIPASVGFFFHTMFNVVDTWFGGLLSTQALAALSLSFPVFFIIIAVGSGISTGTMALISNALGAGDRAEARLFGIQGITFGVLVSITLTVFGIYVSPVLFHLLGASDDYLNMCLIYMNTIFIGTIFFMLIYMLNAILIAMGDTRSFRNFLIVGFFLNIIFDPWFIYGGLGIPPLGITGIALATVLIQSMGGLYLGIKVYRTGLISRKALKDIFPKPAYFKEIALQGFPASLNTMTVGMGIFVITYFISKFGKEAVAAYGIATRVEQIVLLPTIGLNTATLTLVAQNNGAKLFDRIKETLNTALRYGGMIMGVGTIVLLMFSDFLMGLFTDDAPVVGIGVTYLKIAAFVLYAYVILYVNVAALQGVKRPMFAIWIGLFRQIIAPVMVFTLFIQILDFGLMGVWWGIFSVTWIAAVFTLFYARVLLKSVFAP
ncbi:MAG: MATE family efflux transporter [Pseudomonadota bacterium]